MYIVLRILFNVALLFCVIIAICFVIGGISELQQLWQFTTFDYQFRGFSFVILILSGINFGHIKF